MRRLDGRERDQLRPIKITTGYQLFAEGSALIEMGLTRVLCSATVEEKLPPFLKGGIKGWVTAEYSMLPRATVSRTARDSTQGKIAGRNQEIQRLIGRSLRSVVDMASLGPRTITIDCDVLQADGGTRTAAITGAYVALYQALSHLQKSGLLRLMPLKSAIAATSAGVINSEEILDLSYEEDSRAEVDFNVVMTGKRELVEVQGTAEGKPFSRKSMDSLLNLAEKGIKELLEAQQKAINSIV